MRLPRLRKRKVYGRVRVVKLCEHAVVHQELDEQGIPDCTDWGCSKDDECAYLEDMTVFCPERDMTVRARLNP